MQGNASKYITVETTASCISNALLNLAAAAALFHGRTQIPMSGPTGLLKDLIGETFLATGLSVLVPTLIARSRMRAGKLPVSTQGALALPRNVYVRSILIGLVATLIFMPLNYLLLPRLFPDGLSHNGVVLFKTVYGALLGSMSTWIALRTALKESK